MRLKKIIRLLRRQDGIALVMAIGVLGVLTISGTTLVYYSNTNVRSAEFSQDNSSAYDLAEAGINEMVAVLAKPDNNALNPNLLPETATQYDAGTVTWSGTLDQSASVWNLTSIGRIKNPTGPGANDVLRKLTAKVPVVPTNTQPSNNSSWNYIMSTRTGDPDGCDMEIGNTVEVKTNLYVFGNLCLKQQAKVLDPPAANTSLVVKQKLDLQTSQNTAGTSAAPLAEAHIGVGCKYWNQHWHPDASHSSHAFCSSVDQVYASTLNQSVETLSPPVAEWNRWWREASPGPFIPCATGGPITFDTNASSTSAPDTSVTGTYNLTPSTSYTCSTLGGELSWNVTTQVLIVRGTIFFDGHVRIDPPTAGTVIAYDGQASIYAYGTIVVKNAKVCAAVANGACDFASWNPNIDLLALVANGSGGQTDVQAGESVRVVNSQLQSAVFGTNKVVIDTSSKIDGPVIGSEVVLGQSVGTDDFPNITTVPAGMPGSPTVYAQVNAPQLYSG